MIALHLLPERDCARCTSSKQKEWGCHATQKQDGSWENKAALPLKLDDEEHWRCPRRPVKDDPGFFRRLFFFHGLYKKGQLPAKGGVVDQSDRMMNLLRLVDHAEDEVRAELQERQRRRANRNRKAQGR